MISAYQPSKRTILCIDDDAGILCYEKALLTQFSWLRRRNKDLGLRQCATVMQCSSTTRCRG
jgi:hypothetical protein